MARLSILPILGGEGKANSFDRTEATDLLKTKDGPRAEPKYEPISEGSQAGEPSQQASHGIACDPAAFSLSQAGEPSQQASHREMMDAIWSGEARQTILAGPKPLTY